MHATVIPRVVLMDHHHDDINIVMSMAKLSGWKFSFSENGDDDDDDDDDDDGDDGDGAVVDDDKTDRPSGLLG